MGEKVLLRVLLPASGQVYEFRVPQTMAVGQGACLIARILGKREQMRYVASEEPDLMYVEGDGAGCLLDTRETFGSLALNGRVVNGTLLALM